MIAKRENDEMITRHYFISLELQDPKTPKFSCGVITIKGLLPNPAKVFNATLDHACKLWECERNSVRCVEFNRL